MLKVQLAGGLKSGLLVIFNRKLLEEKVKENVFKEKNGKIQEQDG